MDIEKEFENLDKDNDKILSESENKIILEYYLAFTAIKNLLNTAFEKYSKDGILTLQEFSKNKRLDTFHNNTIKQMSNVYVKNNKIINSMLEEIYQLNYFKTGFLISFNTGLNLKYSQLKDVGSLIKNPVYDISDTLNKNKVNAIYALKSNLLLGLNKGESYYQIAKRLKQEMNISADRAVTIARTEGNRVLNQSRLDSYEQANKTTPMKKRWVGTLDGRTRESHQRADGQIVEMDKSFNVGGEKLQYPGDSNGSGWNTVRCRCTTIPVFEGFDYSTRYNQQDRADMQDMTYDEWLNSLN